ncbi:MAG: stage III sporulation protein AG [Pseudoflavonifractor sp.]
MKPIISLQGWGKKISGVLGQYKYIALVILVGIVLLILPPISGRGASAPKTGGEAALGMEFDLPAAEKRLEKALSDIQGAGKTTVVLTLKSSTRQVIAQDDKTSEQEKSLTTVVVSRGSGVEDAVLLQQIYPQFRGALVVCPGGGDPGVRLKLTQAVSAVTGLGSNRISICEGN